MKIAPRIATMYRAPRRVFSDLFAEGEREDHALLYLMVGCLLTFVAQWPGLARQAFETAGDLQPLLGGALLAWIFIAPLVFYLVAAGIEAVLGLLRLGTGSYHRTRLILFWSWLAATPLLLLWGLLRGFLGAGPGLQVVGGLWLLCFAAFFGIGMVEARRSASVS